MSQENVEIVRGIMQAMNRGDADYAIGHTTEDVVLVVARSAVVGPFVGHEGIREFFADNRENFEVFQLREDEVQSVADGRVLMTGVVHFRGRGGAVETDVPFAGVATFRDGKASRWEEFRERDLALKAVGLEE